MVFLVTLLTVLKGMGKTFHPEGRSASCLGFVALGLDLHVSGDGGRLLEGQQGAAYQGVQGTLGGLAEGLDSRSLGCMGRV
ncbi:hypothetical protein CYMTET_45414 [Cymbomonas tetramitiformis]|uniref:Uncharacterized protein n=1 Tax=Cymbomonas tetramitiformis TaxID=36881 RepID=A0AAE0BY95_9CHLO|nr:hypothetical protein CYMTET_45414 [Cymbomonas tetramitiformis]